MLQSLYTMASQLETRLGAVCAKSAVLIQHLNEWTAERTAAADGALGAQCAE